MKTVLTPKLRLRAGDWEAGDTWRWVCDCDLRQLFRLGTSKTIQIEISSTRLMGGYAFWFRWADICLYPPSWRVCWGTTRRECLVHRADLYVSLTNLLRRCLKVRKTPTKLYVRLWLLTGEDAQDD